MPSSPLPLVSRLIIASRSFGHRPLVAAALLCSLIQPASADVLEGDMSFVVWPSSGLISSTPIFFGKGTGPWFMSYAERLSDGDLLLHASGTEDDPQIVPLVVTQKYTLSHLTRQSAGAIAVELQASAPLVPGKSYVLREKLRNSAAQDGFKVYATFGHYQVIAAAEESGPPPRNSKELGKGSVSLNFVGEDLRLTLYGVQHSLQVKADAGGASRLILLAKDSAGRIILSLDNEDPPSSPTLMSFNRETVEPCLFVDESWAPVRTIEAIGFLAHAEKGETQEIKVNTNPLTTSVLVSLARLRPKHSCARVKGDDRQDSE